MRRRSERLCHDLEPEVRTGRCPREPSAGRWRESARRRVSREASEGRHSHLPGLCHPPAAPLAAKEMGQRYDGMVTAVLKGGLPASTRVLKWFKLFTLTESLGGVESLIEIRRS